MNEQKKSTDQLKIMQIGYAVPKQTLDEVTKWDAYPQIQATKLLWRIISGIEESASCPVDLIGAAPASDFPRNPQIFFGFQKWAHKPGAEDTVLPFINLIFLKHFTRFISSLFLIVAWLIKNRQVKNRHLLIYAMHSPFIFAAVLSKLFFKVKVTLIVPDLPAFMNVGIKTGVFRRIAKKLDTLAMGAAIGSMAGLIVLTKHAGKAIGSPTTPKLVVEGAVSLDELPNLRALANVRGDRKIVMFTGALVGLDILLNAFKLIEDKNIHLYISGKGPMERQVIEASNSDHRITYLGFLSTEALQERMSEATVFVNVRSAKTPFIEFSFPSKLLEYMATGRPTISTILPGIPDEYHDYLYLIQEESSEYLARLITAICRKTTDELDIFGGKARDYVRTQKNYLHQGDRIYKFMQTL